MDVKAFAREWVWYAKARVRTFLTENRCRRMAARYNLNGYKRVYFVHIRKTGGTSLNHMFLSLSGGEAEPLYDAMVQACDHRLIHRNLIFVGWHLGHINEGNYYYAFSHTPLHELDLPERTFIATCFRDPVRRVVSHYNMLMGYRANRVDHPCMAVEGEWLGSSFGDFLKRIPREHLLNQLYMFSRSCDIDEALESVTGIDHYFFTDSFEQGIRELNEKTGLSLQPMHSARSDYRADISETHLRALKDLLKDEYRFVGTLRERRRVGFVDNM